MLSDVGAILLRAIPTFFLVIFLFFYLKGMFFGPLEKVLAERRAATEGARKQAKTAIELAEAKVAQYEAQLRAARAAKLPLPPFPDIPFERQVRIVMEHLRKLVEAAGSNMDCLLKVSVWLKDQRQQEEFDRIYRTYFTSQETLPARTRLQAGRMPLDCGVEVEAIGYVP